jgi:hypothetical protein|tara:strand:+ start:670 stop:1128 length:459 start_codon:yes stop_codon:yes gene_type:complete
MEKSKFEILTYQNYLSMIKASQGSKMFRRVYVLDNHKKRDILKGGQLSCAYYVSCILKIFNLISDLHTTVDGAVKDILENKWELTEKLVSGNILVWEDKESLNGEIHSHLGFYLGQDKAISNSGNKRAPIIHHYTYNQERKIIKILTHKIIE